MKNRLSKSLAFSAILMMLLSTMAIFPVHAQTDPEFYLVPSDPVFDTSTTSPCHKFNITLMVKDLGTPVWAWQVKTNIIPAGDWINITRAWTASWDPTYIFYGMPRAPVMPAFYDLNFDNCFEGVLIGDSLASPASPVTGSGPFILGIIELHLVKAPAKYETLYADLNIDNVDTYLLDDNIQTITPVIKTDGSVTYGWSPPTTDPHMAVVPDNVLIDQYT
ncbi:hypothetical protein KAU55_04490, partial [Candidatus Bathyarchaeota archaeon]|nr:hypothetical protein [Candidatus Bathyarchaeota archaeon]